MTYLNADEVGKVLLDYIGSEEYKKAVSCIQGEENAFMSGIGMAGVLIMSRCKKYIGMEEKKDA